MAFTVCLCLREKKKEQCVFLIIPDLRRWEIKNSFSLIVDVACLNLCSMSDNAFSVCSNVFYKQKI